jgi:hypothetical protein
MAGSLKEVAAQIVHNSRPNITTENERICSPSLRHHVPVTSNRFQCQYNRGAECCVLSLAECHSDGTVEKGIDLQLALSGRDGACPEALNLYSTVPNAGCHIQGVRRCAWRPLGLRQGRRVRSDPYQRQNRGPIYRSRQRQIRSCHGPVPQLNFRPPPPCHGSARSHRLHFWIWPARDLPASWVFYRLGVPAAGLDKASESVCAKAL